VSTICLGALGSRTYASMTRRGMHDPVPSPDEALVRAHAECSEVFEAWIARHEPACYAPVARVVQFVPGGFITECVTHIGKPEGVAAELADVVLSLSYYAYRVGLPGIWLELDPHPCSLPCTVVEAIGRVHHGIAWREIEVAIVWCFAIAHELQIDLPAAIERKAAYNDVRPPTTRRL
jgi:hypothetical protein